MTTSAYHDIIQSHVQALRKLIDERRNWTDEQRRDDFRVGRWITHAGADVLPMVNSDCPWLLEDHKPAPQTVYDWLPNWLGGEASPEKHASLLWAVMAVFAPTAAPDWSDLALPIERHHAPFDFSDAEHTAEGQQFAESWRRQHAKPEPTVMLVEEDLPAPSFPLYAVLRGEVDDHCDLIRWRGPQTRATPEVVEVPLARALEWAVRELEAHVAETSPEPLPATKAASDGQADQQEREHDSLVELRDLFHFPNADAAKGLLGSMRRRIREGKGGWAHFPKPVDRNGWRTAYRFRFAEIHDFWPEVIRLCPLVTRYQVSALPRPPATPAN